MKAKRAKPARVYPAESDPRQVKISHGTTVEALSKTASADEAAEGLVATHLSSGVASNGDPGLPGTVALLAREFGPWVRAEDGSWMRKKVRG